MFWNIDGVYHAITWEVSIDGAFLDVGLFLDWGVFTPGENKRIYNEYGDCAFPLYKCFSQSRVFDFRSMVSK